MSTSQSKGGNVIKLLKVTCLSSSPSPTGRLLKSEANEQFQSASFDGQGTLDCGWKFLFSSCIVAALTPQPCNPTNELKVGPIPRKALAHYGTKRHPLLFGLLPFLPTEGPFLKPPMLLYPNFQHLDAKYESLHLCDCSIDHALPRLM